MIVVELMGGLGNQMFQYASALRLAKHCGTDLLLDISWYGNIGQATTKRVYELGCFKLDQNFINPEDYTVIQSGSVLTQIKNRAKLLGGRNMLRNFPEEHYHFDFRLLSAANNTYLTGYWQSEKYFADIANTIRSNFVFKSPLAGQNAVLAKQIMNTTSVSLHVRRGDYVSDKTANHFHGTSPLDYYYNAVKELTKKVKNPHFFVISDDPAWCKANLKIDYPTTFITNNPPDKGFEDMRLMSLCKHHIIANSSFSWWGAWLDPNPDKLVFAPKQWFNDPSINTNDVIPEPWIRL